MGCSFRIHDGIVAEIVGKHGKLHVLLGLLRDSKDETRMIKHIGICKVTGFDPDVYQLGLSVSKPCKISVLTGKIIVNDGICERF